MLAGVELRDMGPAKTQAEAKKNILRAIDAVSERLGNTRTVCRKYYVHPALLHAYMQGLTAAPSPSMTARRSRRKPPVAALRRDEVAILQFLNDVL
jgi:DNA topoisomerase-1